MASETGDRPQRVMTWGEYQSLEGRLASAVLAHPSKDEIGLVIGIFRGGMVLARSLASKLGDVPLSILDCRAGREHSPSCIGDVDVPAGSTHQQADILVLLVDDISDSGNTFVFMHDYLASRGFKRILTAALVYKSYSRFKPDFFAMEDRGPAWHVFPWETTG